VTEKVIYYIKIAHGPAYRTGRFHGLAYRQVKRIPRIINLKNYLLVALTKNINLSIFKYSNF